MSGFVEFHSNKNPRLSLFYYIFLAFFLVLIFGLGWRQLIHHDDYETLEERQSLRRIIQPGPRGEIYDRNDKLLVGNRPIFNAVIYIAELRHDFEKEYFSRVRTLRDSGLNVNRDKLRKEARISVIERHLEPVERILGRPIDIKLKDIDRYFNQRLLIPLPIAKDLSVFEYAKLTEQLPVESPIQVQVESARYYPYGSLAAHAIGYVGSTEDISLEGIPGKHLRTFTIKGKVGKQGLEKSFNDELEGISGGEIWVVDPKGFQYELVAKQNPQKGKSFKCSLDIDLQLAAENALAHQTGAAVVLDVETGEVLALASSPSFDLNDLTPSIPTSVYDDISQRGGWLNRTTQGLYPPASPFKIVTSIAALRAGIMNPEDTFECGSFYLVGNRKFLEHNPAGYGQVDLERALQVSCNVYFYPLGLQVGADKLAQEARNFHLDQPTGIELPYESKNMIVADPQWKKDHVKDVWRGGDTANMCIGQGFLRTTPLQMACFAASIARNETKTSPTLIYNPNRDRSVHAAKPIGLPDEYYQSIINGMTRCAELGSAKAAQVPGLTFAAKTGTGQARYQGKKYTVPWFLGFAPATDPKIAIVVIIEGKDDSLWGRHTCPIAQTILSAYHQKYSPKPTPETSPTPLSQ